MEEQGDPLAGRRACKERDFQPKEIKKDKRKKNWFIDDFRQFLLWRESR
jgi:hypothetical protein